MQYGRPWLGEDVNGLVECEKLDHCRHYLDGSQMFSRSGRVIQAVAAVTRNGWSATVCFIVVDAREIGGRWPKRISAAKKKLRCNFAAVVLFEVVRDVVRVSCNISANTRAWWRGIDLAAAGASYSDDADQ